MVYVNKVVDVTPKKAETKVEKQEAPASTTEAKPKRGKKSES